MTPGARLQTSIELIDSILSETYPADQIITRYFRQHRYIGSQDRRVISEWVYGTLRHYFSLKALFDDASPRLYVLGYLKYYEHIPIIGLKNDCDGSAYHPVSLTSEEMRVLEQDASHKFALNIPTWTSSFFEAAFAENASQEIDALNHPASFDLRVNTLKTTREAVLQALQADQIEATSTPFSPIGLRLDKRRPLSNHYLWQQGHIEVQDEGSQLVSLLVNAQPGETILDLCAGAGGKTLALAAMMQNKGKLIGMDVVPQRLTRAKERLRRAGVHSTELRLIESRWLSRQQGRFDRVLVDAPCSGSGTWRRNPDLKIRFTADDLAEVTRKQASLLDQAVPLVKPNGFLIYATCSLFPPENQDQVAAFLRRHPNFQQVALKPIWEKHIKSPYPATTDDLLLTPYQQGCDGFFIAVFKYLS